MSGPAPGSAAPARQQAPIQLHDYVTALGWSPDGTLLAAVSLAGDLAVAGGAEADGDGAVGLGTALHAAHLTGVHPGGGLCLAWSADGRTLATGGQDGSVALHRVAAGGATAGSGGHLDLVTRNELGGWVNALAWDPSGRPRLAAAAGRQTVVLSPDGVVLGAHTSTSTVTSLAWSADGGRIAAGTYGSVTWVDPADGAEVKRFDWKGSILTLATAPNGKWVASGNQDNSVHVWRLWTAEELEMTGYAPKIQHLAWDPSSRWLCVGDVGEVTCWDFSGRGPRGSRPRTLDGHTRRITALDFSKRATLASASADGTIRLWQLPKTKPLAVLDVGEEIAALAWHPSAQTLATGLADGRVEVLDAAGA